GKLPDRHPYYVGAESGLALFEFFGPLLFGVLQAPDTPGDREARAAVREYLRARPGTRVECFGYPAHGLEAWTCAEPAKAVEAQLKLYRSLGPGDLYRYAGGVLEEKAEIKTNAQAHAGFTLHSARFTRDTEKTLGLAGKDVPKEQADKMRALLKKA